MAAWVLNLDADLELGAPPGYLPSKSVIAATRVHAERLAATLLAEEDVWIEQGVRAEGMLGRAFCPTPRALAALVRAGAIPEAAPSVDVLRRVNARTFSPSRLPGARLVMGREVVRDRPPLGDGWRIKPNFGMAGRGHRVLQPPFEIEGPVQLEPNVEIEVEYAIHGLIAPPSGGLGLAPPSGGLTVGRLVRQRCVRGTWIRSEPCDDAQVQSRMTEEALRVADDLRAAGYFGPFGIDAFAYRGGFQPCSEINARYSMGFPVGFQGKSR